MGGRHRRRSAFPVDYRGIAVLILASAVSIGLVMFAALAVIDLYNPPQDSKLGRTAMTIGAGAVAGAMSLIGVYLGMGAGMSKSMLADQIKGAEDRAESE